VQHAVRVSEVTKWFRRYGSEDPRLLKDYALSGFRARQPTLLTALDNVSLDVAPGRSVGVIGPNGAGKSTLLRLIGGVGRPNAGRIEINGRVGAIFELGTGFHPELSGRESATLAGIIAGLRRDEVRRRLPSIVEFAELEDYIDAPLRTYSSGMRARLAFSVATHVDADVLLVDEVLAVGDVAFQTRCVERMKDFRRAGTTILLVSHQQQFVDLLCDEVVWLDEGKIVAHGPTEDVGERYVTAMLGAERATTSDAAGTRPLRMGTHEATVDAVRVLDSWAGPVSSIPPGGGLIVAVDLTVPAALAPVRLAVHVVSRDGTMCVDTSVQVDGDVGNARLNIERLDLASGSYDVDVGLYSADWSHTFDFHWHAAPFTVLGDDTSTALVTPPLRWALGPRQAPGPPG